MATAEYFYTIGNKKVIFYKKACKYAIFMLKYYLYLGIVKISMGKEF